MPKHHLRATHIAPPSLAPQRRRTAEDELAMRSIFREGDLLSAEVQALHQEGGCALQTRTMKFGRLVAGQLVQVG